MIKDLFVPYTQALELKQLGFDEPCILLYRGLDIQPVCQMNYELKTEKNSDYADETNYWITIPTFSQAFEFFREKYNLLGCTQYFTGGYYCYTINDMKDTKESNRLFTEFSSFKEAELACLEKLIEIVKNK